MFSLMLPRFWPKAGAHAIWLARLDAANPLRLSGLGGKIHETMQAERLFEAEDWDYAADLPKLRCAI